MSKIWDEVRQEGYEIGYKEGYKIGYEEGYKIGLKDGFRERVALNLWNAGYQDLEMIHKITKLPVDQIKSILSLS